MAIYHFHGQVISRSAGRSSVAAAAYRSAEKLLDERTELTHDFTKKENDLLYKEILAPEKAPEWMKDRVKLWNAVEQGEKRKDAQLAREFNISLPRELTNEQNIELAKTFVQKNFVDKGMVADLCIHKGHIKDGEEQPHMHVMVTMREITPDGFGPKVREWNSKELMNEWRKEWAKEANFFLALNGHDMRIDHRRLEEQGIELEPQKKIGTSAAYERMARFEEHQQIARANGERLYKDPEIALKAITNQQSTFTHQDLARFINRHSADKEQFDKVYNRVRGCNEIVLLGRDDQNRERFTSKEMLNTEHRMIRRAVDMSEQAHFLVDDKIQSKVLKGYDLSSEQKTAFLHVTEKKDIACVKGYAGTGKSYMLGAAREAWEAQGYNVQGMTLSGKAAENLEISSGIKSNTVANRLINWEHDRARLTNKDIIVIDEAVMVGSYDMDKIITEAYHAKAKVVALGDIEQIQAIQAGAAYRAIADHIGYVEMTDIRRQHEKWQQDATKQFATGRTAEGLLAYEEKGHVHSFETKAYAMDAMIAHWDETRSSQPDKSHLMMSYTRDDTKDLNERAREIRQKYNELGENHVLQTPRGKREFAENDRVYFLKNDKDLHVKNGTLGTIKSLDDRNNVTVILDRENENKPPRELCFNAEEYNHLEYGYAATIHKAQGSTVDYGYVLASKYMDRQVTYSAMSRHRDNAELFYSKEDFKSFEQLSRTLERENKKDITLDYTGYGKEYAEVRGLEPVLPQEKTHDRATEILTREISPERLRAAEERLAEKQFRENFAPELRQFERDTGRTVNLTLEEGEKGIYRGTVKFGEERYGILEKSEEIKLVPYQHCHDLDRGKEAKIEKAMDDKGHELHRAVPTKERTREREIELEMER